jgi:hypothetical protein
LRQFEKRASRRLSANTGICEYLKGGERESKREHSCLWGSERRLHGASMRLSANTGICRDLRGGKCEDTRTLEFVGSERRLRGASMRLSANTGICGELRGGEYEAKREHWYLWDLRGGYTVRV